MLHNLKEYTKNQGLTKLIPQHSAFVRHWCSLGLPQDQPRVGQELLRDHGQHPGAVVVTHPEHFPNL